MRHLLAACVALWLCQPSFAADEWKPAKGPLMTKWSKDVKADKVHPEYPRPQLVREKWANLNGIWQFAEAKEGEKPPVGKDLDGRILVPFPVESALSGVMKPLRRLWYRRTFTVPKDWAGQRVWLNFGAVNWDSTVWVNGKQVWSHQGGYNPFFVDVTDHLKKDGDQELIVGVHNPVDAGTQPRGKQVLKPGGIYYTPSTGIWQTVWLEPVSETHLGRLWVTPQIKGGKVEVYWLVMEPGQKRLGIEWEVLDGKKVVASGGGPTDFSTVAEVPSPRLWSPESPHLYDLRVTLKEGKKVLDRVTSYFAFREVKLGQDRDGVTRLTLNGKPYFQVGLLDQGFWPDGLYTAPTDEALKYDIEVTKKLGFNMIRKHVKVEPARWYHHCDKLGVLVWQDMPSGDKDVQQGKGEMKRTKESAGQFELELRRMIHYFQHFPCIVMWVPFNEGWGQFDTKRIAEFVKKLDKSRLVNSASGWNDMKCGDVHDWHIYPGPGSPKPEKDRAAVLGEFGGVGLKVEGHAWTEKTWGYIGARDKADLTNRYERLLRECYRLKDRPGLSAVVYTQTTDVEAEANGLLTYDRAVIKVDVERVKAANQGDFSRVPTSRVVVPTSETVGQAWRYVLDRPGDGWMKSDFDDSKWLEGKGGFGTKGTPGAVVRTEWKSKTIWLRRTFTLPEKIPGNLLLRLHHDEDAEVYVNGVVAIKVKGYITDYDEFTLSAEAIKALKPGKNTLAVHCKQTGGGQYIDVGIVEVVPPKKKDGK